ncbi:glycosyl hydrolase [Streptomyces sp. NPDC048560]|uniref:glycoside hydrolase family 26 protein n=1 Tax=Streptomyces sp. NPDC048560 TaxID=3155488 RepID=UPI00342D2202
MSAQRRLINICVGTAALSLLAAGGIVATTSTGTDTTDGAPPSRAADDGTTAHGAYVGYGPEGVRRTAELSRWLGGAELRAGHSYLPGDLWSNIEGKPDFLRSWATWRNADEDRMFVLNVPMLERNEEGVGDAEVRRLLRAGAAGDYDHHFRRLAERLVQLSIPDTVIVLGWEMNGITYTHRCGPDPTAWKAYWNRIVTTMRAVPGQKFRFDFAPSRGTDAVPWTRCYPGDDVVDIIGMDTYDQPPGRSFEEQVNGPYGLQKHVDFAAEHDKPISFPEWGLFRNGDNSVYMRRMLEWIEKHDPVYQTITDYCPHGVWQCSENPQSSRTYRSMMSKNPAPSATPDPSPSPTTPARPPTPKPTKPTPTAPAPEPNSRKWCITVPLSDWLGRWLTDRQFCVRY